MPIDSKNIYEKQITVLPKQHFYFPFSVSYNGNQLRELYQIFPVVFTTNQFSPASDNFLYDTSSIRSIPYKQQNIRPDIGGYTTSYRQNGMSTKSS